MTTTPATTTTLCGVTLAAADGIVYPLTPCCGASGKGSESPTGVVCRACYMPVSIEFGDCAEAGQVARVASWVRSLGDCPAADGCASCAMTALGVEA